MEKLRKVLAAIIGSLLIGGMIMCCTGSNQGNQTLVQQLQESGTFLE